VKPRRTSVVTAVVAAGAAVTALALCAPGFAATARPHSAAIASTASTSSDPLAVYFRHDAVGRAQLSLALSQCGTERWSVKTATDDDRHRVDSKPRDVSIRYLRARHTPSYRPPTGRVGPVELTTYRVSARLVEYVREADGDDHLVLADSAGRTIIAEVPDPSCVAHISPVKAAIRAARAHLDAQLGVTTDFKTTNRRVVVRGIGFFDYFHGQTGMAPNDLELHPVTGLRFR
jgi:hypothetical protein